jgi:RNA polymerase sigma-70 factor (ECF subfamily)
MGASDQTMPSSSSSARGSDADSGMTSLTMLELAQAHDPRAWQRLVQLYSPLIASWGRRMGLAEEDTADVLQEVWRAVAANLERFEKSVIKGTFRGWLWAITRNKLRDHFRNRQGRPVAAGGTDAHTRLQEIPEEEPPDPAESAQADSPTQFLYRALELVRADFEARTWDAFWRVTVEGHAATDVARDVGISVESVYQAKSRVLRRLRHELQGLVDLSAVEPLTD